MRYRRKPVRAWSGGDGLRSGLLLGPLIYLAAFAIQAGVTGVYTNLGGCGPGYYETQSRTLLLAPWVGAAVVVALGLGAFSFRAGAAD